MELDLGGFGDAVGGMAQGAGKALGGLMGGLTTTANIIAGTHDDIQAKKERQRQMDVITDSAVMLDHVNNGRIEDFNRVAVSALDNKIGNMVDPSHTLQIADWVNSGDPELVEKGKNELRDVLREAQVRKLIPKDKLTDSIISGGSGNEDVAEIATFKYLTAGLSKELVEKAKKIDLGLIPRAVGSSSQTITNEGTAGMVAQTEATIAGAKEGAKLSAQYELKPKVEAAVATAVAHATLASDAIKEQRSNATTYNVYNTGMENLYKSMGGTTTGPFVGILPAITTNQQIADGAVAVMAPVLKQMFRAAGEGVFTDKDQEMLLQMVPSRTDTPEARVSKIGMIDMVVKAKLGITDGGGQRTTEGEMAPSAGGLSPDQAQRLQELRQKQAAGVI
jgi:hypothetical protein